MHGCERLITTNVGDGGPKDSLKETNQKETWEAEKRRFCGGAGGGGKDRNADLEACREEVWRLRCENTNRFLERIFQTFYCSATPLLQPVGANAEANAFPVSLSLLSLNSAKDGKKKMFY